MSYQP